jgi:hypothetical protein
MALLPRIMSLSTAHRAPDWLLEHVRVERREVRQPDRFGFYGYCEARRSTSRVWRGCCVKPQFVVKLEPRCWTMSFRHRIEQIEGLPV